MMGIEITNNPLNIEPDNIFTSFRRILYHSQ